MCALHAAAADPRLSITIVSKGAVGRSGCTRMVQGGYNAVLGAGDSIERAFRATRSRAASTSTTRSSRGRSSTTRRGVIHELEDAVRLLLRPARADGQLDQKPFGGQSFDRTVHRGDLTGHRDHGPAARPGAPDRRTRARGLAGARPRASIDDGELAGLTVLDTRRPARLPCSLRAGSSSSPPAGRRRCTGSRRPRARRRATGWRCAGAPGSSCATWRCCSSTRRGCVAGNVGA